MITPIAQLEGTVVEAGSDGVVLMVGGVGYGLQVPAHALARLRPGSVATFHTYLVAREDGMTLFGFLTPEERKAFAGLLTVSGIGPKAALTVLSAMSPRDLAAAVAAGDLDALRRLPGIGPKTAARMVLELRGTLDGTGALASLQSADDDALLALLALGYSAEEASRALDGAGGDVEERVRAALLRMGQGKSA
ncbi:MAG TPA: Holliday junction branch migration protein RuvA [Dehalococcoidia bacterium]|nr:Holliday junction branch migration protein RuvA [Dehalococcoidia bacterium]